LLEIIAGWDAEVLLWIQESVRNDLFTPLLIFYTHLGDSGMLWITMGGVLLVFPRTRNIGIMTLASLFLGAMCTNVVLKHLVGRIRPYYVVEGLVALVTSGDPNSFPSGHTCAAFAVAGIWMHCLPQKWSKGASLACAVLMGCSRLYVGVHFPSDVLAGALVGFLCSRMTLHFFQHLENSMRKQGKTLPWS